jgi:hypothetical protein
MQYLEKGEIQKDFSEPSKIANFQRTFKNSFILCTRLHENVNMIIIINLTSCLLQKSE